MSAIKCHKQPLLVIQATVKAMACQAYPASTAWSYCEGQPISSEATTYSPAEALIVLEQPRRCRASTGDEVLPPPGLLRPLHLVAALAGHQCVALVLVVRVEAPMGVSRRRALVQPSAVGISLQDEVHAAGVAHVRGEAHSLGGLGVSRSPGAHDVGARSEEAPVVSTVSCTGGRD